MDHAAAVDRQASPPSLAPALALAPLMNVCDVRWETGALGLRFMSTENGDLVVCEIMAANTDQRVAVGDVVLAVQVQAVGAPVAPITSIREMVQVLEREELPMTVRFRSRAHEVPQAIELVDIAHSYTYTWPPDHPLGVSLAMDLSLLQTIITAINRDRISADFVSLDPQPGDILVSVGDAQHKAALDTLRFDQAVETLKSFPRPCQLTFLRLREKVTSPTRGERTVNGQRANVRAADPMAMQPPLRPLHAHAAVPQTPFSQPPASQSQGDARKKARFYTIVYSGGELGLELKDAALKLKGKPKKNGYYALVKSVPRHSQIEGMDQAKKGDELISIGTHDLKHVAFEDVLRELSAIRFPTPLVFERKANHSVAGSIADGLLMFLM